MLSLLLMFLIVIVFFRLMFQLGIGLVKVGFGLIGLIAAFVFLPLGLIVLIPVLIIGICISVIKVIF